MSAGAWLHWLCCGMLLTSSGRGRMMKDSSCCSDPAHVGIWINCRYEFILIDNQRFDRID